MSRRASLVLIAATACLLLIVLPGQRWLGARPSLVEATVAAAEPLPTQGPETKTPQAPASADEREVTPEERLDAIGRAHVWRQPAVAIARAHLGATPHAPRELGCKFKLSQLGGTTPKFDCVLPSGETVRIKYGKGPEIPAEAAATRLLKALGFGADDITLIERLRCYGCPEEPFSTMRVVAVTRAEPIYKHVIDYNDYEDFEWVALERKLDARPLRSAEIEGWAFFELDQVQAARGGADRTHVDALRLIAAFLAHWDNKSENQRLVCLARDWPDKAPCPRPFLLIQDTGATFGPSKVDLEAWETSAIWADRSKCTVSMRHLPYEGATFGEARIGETGRQFISRLLKQLSDRQIAELFSGARFDQKRGLFSGARPITDWLRAFKGRVRMITDGAPCPAA